MNSSKLLQADDILALPGLVYELCDSDHPVAQHLAGMLPRELLQELREQNKDGFVRPGLVGKLLDELNDLLASRCIYEPKSFEYARLTEHTLRLAAQRPSGAELVVANRLLLTEAFPCIFRLVYSRKLSDGRINNEWYEFHVNKFAKIRPDYQRFCGLLEYLLGEARADCAPLAIIQARPKTVSSFAEKALRKGYGNPLCQSTDLAAARVITETQEEVEEISEWVKRNFLIDDVNSVDHREKLKADEFGYLSVHYVVSLKKDAVQRLTPDSLVQSGADDWYFLAGKKAEIQIRTLLQHAHASVVHDRLYKSAFSVPEDLQRDLARVSALLEEADTAFAQTIASIEAYRGSYGAYMDAEKRGKETTVLEAVLQHEKDAVAMAEAALKLALLKKAVWDWPGVVETLLPHLTTSFREQPRLEMEYGYALCRVHQANPRDPAYGEGVRRLRNAVDSTDPLGGDPLLYPKRLRVEAHSSLAWAYGNCDHDPHAAREQYRRAHGIDPTNPYILASYLGFEIGAGGTRRDDVSRLMEQTLIQAASRCQEHVRAGVELPWAYLTMGRLYLLAGRFPESLSAYCKAIHLCAGGLSAPDDPKAAKPAFPREILDDELGFLTNIGRDRKREDDEWVEDLLWLGLYLNYKARDALDVLAGKSVQADMTTPVVIVSGGTHPDVESEMRSYADCLERGFDGFRGTLISGGTKVGIPGMVGELAERLRKSGLEVHARCYLPKYLPADAPPDPRYDEVIPDVGRQFSQRQLIQTWIDLLVAGVEPSTVKLLGFNGGPLTLLEYRLALAMGALVGVVRESGRAASELAPDPDWADARNLLWLPRDPMSVWAFVNPAATARPSYVEEMGRQIHEDYLSQGWPKSKDRIMRPWQYLDEDIRESNIQQAAFAETILRSNGYEVRPKQGPITLYEFGPDEDEAVHRMAEMEHGRWNVERLRSGWRYGPVKDEVKRVSPYLLPWKELTDEVRGWDCAAVRKWPELLKRSGLEVHRL